MYDNLDLNIVLLTGFTKKTEWLDEFHKSLAPLESKIIKSPGVLNDLDAARRGALDKVHASFCMNVDDDDMFEPEVIASLVEFLERNPSYAAASSKDQLVLGGAVYKKGSGINDGRDDRKVVYTKILKNPLYTHNATVFRTSMLREVYAALLPDTFVNIDWVSKMVLAYRYPVYRSRLVGGYYRLHDNGFNHPSARKLCKGVSYEGSYERLAQRGLLPTV